MGKADFKRYAESGQVMINRAMHLGELCYASSYLAILLKNTIVPEKQPRCASVHALTRQIASHIACPVDCQ